MQSAKVFWTAVALMLIVGATAGAALVTVPYDENLDPVQVAHGRVGDELHYAYLVRGDHITRLEAKGEGRFVQWTGVMVMASRVVDDGTDRDWVPVGEESVRIHQHTTTMDEHGQTRTVLEIVANRTNAYTGNLVEAGLIPLVGYTSGVQHEFVDLEHRHLLRLDHEALGADSVLRAFADRDPLFPGLQYQGLLMEPNADATTVNEPRTPILPVAKTGAIEGELSSRFGYSVQSTVVASDSFDTHDDTLPPGAAFSSAVSKHGAVDGAPSLGVVSTVTLSLPQKEPTGILRAFWDEQRAGGTLEITRTDWVTDGFAYPLANQWSVLLHTPDGEEESLFEHLRLLVDHREGNGDEIRWGEAGGKNPEWERTPGTSPLQQGDVSLLPYPLETALADIDQDPTLLQYRLWRMEHPDALLVSVVHAPGDQRAGTEVVHQWTFVFAEPGKSAFLVTTERIEGHPVVWTQEVGEDNRFAEVSEDVMPRDGLTVTSVESLWGHAFPEAPAPNLLAWGFAHVEDNEPYCLTDRHGFPRPGSFVTVLVGHAEAHDCLDAEHAHSENILLANLEQARPLYGYGVQHAGGLLGGPSVQEGDPVRMHGGTVASAPAGVIEAALFGSTSLLALFLLGWFLPVVKFFAVKGFFALPGFSRLSKDRLLDHKLRDRLMTMITENPGIHASELKRRTGAGWGTVVHHLGVMEQKELLTSVTSGRHRRFFPVGAMDWSRRGQAAVLANERTRGLYDAITSEPGIVMSELANREGIGLSTAGWHLGRLEESGLVGRVKRGRKVQLYANDDPLARNGTDGSGMEVA